MLTQIMIKGTTEMRVLRQAVPAPSEIPLKAPKIIVRKGKG